MAPTIKTEASIQKPDRKKAKAAPGGHSTEYKRDKLIDKVRNARPMRNGVPYDPEALVAEYERAMDVKIVNKDTDASLYSVGKVIDDVWHLHLEDMSDFRVFCNGVAVAHRHSGAADTAAENVERLGRLARFRKVYTRMYGHPPPDQYYGEGGNPPHPPLYRVSPPLKGEKIAVFAQTLTGNTHTVEIGKDNDLMKLYELLSDKGGYPIDQLRIIYKSKQLLNDTRCIVKDYLQDGCLVSILLLMRGC